VNPRVEQLARHCQSFGEARAVFETAYGARIVKDVPGTALSRADRGDLKLTATEVGYLAARLRRLKRKRPANAYRNEHGALVYWPSLNLTEREKRNLTRMMLREGASAKKVSNHLGVSTKWVEAVRTDLNAEAEFREVIGSHRGEGIGPIDSLDSSVDTSLYERLSRILGHRSSSASNGPRQLSGSGIGDRFGRLVITDFGVNPRGRRVAKVVCDCGTIKEVEPSKLGRTKSCGCLRQERAAAIRGNGR
jgi:hypothetical protein